MDATPSKTCVMTQASMKEILIRKIFVFEDSSINSILVG